jgi:putative transcriptional regulator
MRTSSFGIADALRCAGARPSRLMRCRRAASLRAIFIFGITTALIGAVAQTKALRPEAGDKEGLFLVARRALGDPLFAKSTVLMLPVKDAPLVVGLIINKRTRVALHELFPALRALRESGATAYFGGPVDIHSRSAIFRSPTSPKNALRVFADVYVTFDSDAIAALVKNSPQVSTLHIFLGRAQWGQAQLQDEMLEGAWYSMRVNSDPIFSDRPDDVWNVLLARVEPSPYVDYRSPSASSNARSPAP